MKKVVGKIIEIKNKNGLTNYLVRYGHKQAFVFNSNEALLWMDLQKAIRMCKLRGDRKEFMKICVDWSKELEVEMRWPYYNDYHQPIYKIIRERTERL